VPPALRWECWDGTAWSEVAVQDETANLSLPGMVDVQWPGVPVPPQLLIIATAGRSIQVSDPRQLASFAPGDLVFLAKSNAGELGGVDAVSGDSLTLRTMPSRDYSQGTVALASLARFGNPRTWIRGRLEADGEPLPTQVNGIHVNAVWASNVETYE